MSKEKTSPIVSLILWVGLTLKVLDIFATGSRLAEQYGVSAETVAPQIIDIMKR